MKYLVAFMILSAGIYAPNVMADSTTPTSWDNLVSELHRIKSIPEGHAYLKKQTVGCSSQSALQRLLVAFNANNMEQAKSIKECRSFQEQISIKILDIYNPLNAHVHLNLPEEQPGGLDYYVMISNIEKKE